MVKTVRRRSVDAGILLQLWEGITCIRQQRQVANIERIQRFMEREYKVPHKEVQKQIACAVKENLLVKEVSMGKKGRAGLDQDGYWCAEESTEESEEPHDWYCFECHKGGDVLCCGTCYRVYHALCAKVDDPEKVIGVWICPVCEGCRKKSVPMSKYELQKVLTHVLNRMKDKARDLSKKLNLNELPNYYNLVYQHVDLATMTQKLNEKKYKALEDFQGDAEALVHVAMVYHGADSDRTNLCKLTLQDCLYDLAEIKLCKDCYIMSNDRSQKDWFCKPCHPPHELVWAQMTGFGYWPAKVLQRNDDKLDVRFFGSRHQRAWIEEDHVVPIDTERSKLKLRIKPSKGWQNAFKELERHRAACAAVLKRKSSNSSSNSNNDKSSRVSTKRKLGSDEEDDIGDGEEDGEEEDGEMEEEEEEEEDGQSEAEHFVRSRSHTDAGQDHSISTSQTSPVATEEPPVKKVKEDQDTAAELEGTSEMEAVKEEKEEEEEEEEVLENEELPSLESTPQDNDDDEDDTTVKEEDLRKALAQQKAKLEAEHKKKLDKAVKDAVKEAVEKAKQEWQTERERLVKEAKDKLTTEIEKTRTETEQKCKKDSSEQIQKLTDEISQTKKKQWCINCEKEAMYHCCWNTSYCSISCQQVHWHQEHKRQCRRKR